MTRTRGAAVKQVLLAGDIVVGVGNIYCSESLFRAGINPKTPARRISLARYQKLAQAIRDVLAEAIVQGGSTLRDFISVNGQSGYFQQSYFVYDRSGMPCRVCGTPVRQVKQGQRSTFYCVQCQK
jgi:formamidopyrimidine-DNA glycosylase